MIDILKFIFGNLEEILPIVVFVIIAIASSMAKNKRRGTTGVPTPAPSPQSDDDYEDDGVDDMYASENVSGSYDDEIRRTLDEIFQAKMPPPSPRPSSGASVRAETTLASADKSEWQRTLDANMVKDAAKAKAKAQIRANRKANNDADTAATAAVYAVDRTHDEIANIGVGTSQTQERLLTAQARNGFVWSEILGTPVGMRGVA